MEKKAFIPYDGFKLIVAALLLLAIIILPASKTTAPQSAVEVIATMETVATIEPMETTEVVATEAGTAETLVDVELPPLPEASADLTYDVAKDGLINTDGELVYQLSADGTSWTPIEIALPTFPEASADLTYDVAKGGLINADGELIYQLSADGISWTPNIPAEMADLQLDGEWSLLDTDGNPAYKWDAESQSWVAPQEQQTNSSTNIVDCPGASEPRLQGGQQAEVLRNVNFRSSPALGENNWIGGFSVGDKLSVKGETSCIPYGDGAYLWWQVERADGTLGWVAEAAANSLSYFLGPVK